MKTIFQRFTVPILEAYKKDYLKVFSVFAFFFILISIFYLSNINIPSHDDPLFHIRFAEIIREQGLSAFSDFHWIYFSKISLGGDYLIYYNFLFYFVLMLFSFAKPLFFGIKLYGVFFASMSFTVIYFFLLKTIKNPFVWTVLLFSVAQVSFLQRMLMARPYTIAPALLIILIYLAYRKKYSWIFWLSLGYFYWHTATFFFPLCFVVIYFLFRGFYEKIIDWKLVASSFFGTLLAVLVSFFVAPGIFSYMRDIIFGVFYDTIIGKKVNLAEGVELYPHDFMNFIVSSEVIFSLVVIGIMYEIYRYLNFKKNKSDELFSSREDALRGTLFFVVILFFLGIFLTGRNWDFFIFFSLVYIAFVFDRFLQSVSFVNSLVRDSFLWGLRIFVFYIVFSNLFIFNNGLLKASPHNVMEETAMWLDENIPDKEVVFNVSWNMFPGLFHFNSNNYYIAGIEPRFLYDYNPQMYWVWWNISENGYVCPEEKCLDHRDEQDYHLRNDDKKKGWYNKEGNLIADIILNSYKSSYIVTDRGHGLLNQIMDNNKRFKKVFEDKKYNSYFVYRIVD